MQYPLARRGRHSYAFRFKIANQVTSEVICMSHRHCLPRTKFYLVNMPSNGDFDCLYAAAGNAMQRSEVAYFAPYKRCLSARVKEILTNEPLVTSGSIQWAILFPLTTI